MSPESALPAISVKGLGKDYLIARNGSSSTTAADALLNRVRHPLQRAEKDIYRALSDISFEVKWGEALGVIGRNGAGKSTLLKILTRVTAPTSGRIELGGRVGSLLEVGTGFHPELTGRENVYLNGTLLGMRRKEIRDRFDEIVDFAGVHRFLDTPVKRYSSGMYVRLAFAVAAHLDSEILAVDEVLAVGDAEFQAKCLAKMHDVASSGRTVILVSHQIQTVLSLCTSAIFLESGQLRSSGSVDEALDEYRSSFARAAQQESIPENRPGTGEVRLASVQTERDVYEPADTKVIEFRLPISPKMIGQYYVSCHILDPDGAIALQCDSRVMNQWFDPEQEVKGALSIRGPWLRPGRYTVEMFVCRSGILDAWHSAATFDIIPILPYPNATTEDGVDKGIVYADFSYERE